MTTTSQPASDLVLRNATTRDGSVVHVAIRDGRVERVIPAASSGISADAFESDFSEAIDLTGFVLLPAPAEAHAHLDKALTWESLKTGHVGLPEAIAAWTRANSRLDTAEVHERAMTALDEQLAHGVTAVRTHVDVCSGERPLAAVQALAAVRDTLAGVIDLQIAFLCRASTPDEVIRAAVEAGADLVGGAPYMEPDPSAENGRLLRLATEMSVGVDLHVDEELDADVASLGDLARRAIDGGVPGGVTASHCVSLGIQDETTVAETVAAVADAGFGVVTLPLTNLYLLGRGWPTSPPRALTAIRPLLDAGVPVAAGGDNLRDPFNPMGTADPLALASLLVTAAHVTVEEAYDMVSVTARRVLGLDPAGVGQGLVADLLAVRAVSLADAIARAPKDRIVVRGGRVVATTETSRHTVLERPAR